MKTHAGGQPFRETLPQVAEAFSRKATVYDVFGQGHDQLDWMRQVVRAEVLANLNPGSRILELNAGTGGDAAFFAFWGYPVHATDLSPGMVAQIQSKAQRPGLQGRLTFQQCSFTELEQVKTGPFQAVYSNMGGLNCTSYLFDVARGIDLLLAPGGTITLVVMPPVCPWEMAMTLRGDLRTGLRRLRRGGVMANVEGVHFKTYYYNPRQVQQAFGPGYRRTGLRGLAVFTPPADHKDFARRHPHIYLWLRRMDERLAGRPPFNAWGDFFILSLKKKSPGEVGNEHDG